MKKPLTTMVPCQKTNAIPLWSKIDYRYALLSSLILTSDILLLSARTKFITTMRCWWLMIMIVTHLWNDKCRVIDVTLQDHLISCWVIVFLIWKYQVFVFLIWKIIRKFYFSSEKLSLIYISLTTYQIIIFLIWNIIGLSYFSSKKNQLISSMNHQ